MVSAITQNIVVSVESSFQPYRSNPELDYYLFSYIISISNESDYTVQLLRRQWYIFDTAMERRSVEGEGVVGEQPVLAPGETYTYESFCQLSTDSGSMHGHYTFRREIDNQIFEARIPQFLLMPDFRKN